MKQLLILSGKGGTGKTTIATSFIELSKTNVYADCDVDAPNLHLMFDYHVEPKQSDFVGMDKAYIDEELCINCGKCVDYCRFNAIEEKPYKVIPSACEGCGVCELVCPVGAITMVSDIAGDLLLYDDNRYFSTAKLKMGSGTSGKLVTEVKKQLSNNTYDEEIAIIDGSPGIGCPVIASISGVDLILIVTEPSLSGISDMKRIIETNKFFKVPTVVCINKADINDENTNEIKKYCTEIGVKVVGEIPFNKKVSQLLNEGKSILNVKEISNNITNVYIKTMEELL